MLIETTARHDPVKLGSGYLYAIEAKDFDMANYDVDEMVEMGYIQGEATINIERDVLRIPTANYGQVASYNKGSTVTFDTNIISYRPENVARFLTGYKRVEGTTYTDEFAADKAQSPIIALVFREEDKMTDHIFPSAQWSGEYNMVFSSDNPIAFNYHFDAMNVDFPNGESGAYFKREYKAQEATNGETSGETSGT